VDGRRRIGQRQRAEHAKAFARRRRVVLEPAAELRKGAAEEGLLCAAPEVQRAVPASAGSTGRCPIAAGKAIAIAGMLDHAIDRRRLLTRGDNNAALERGRMLDVGSSE
jgi:hypothetical protein